MKTLTKENFWNEMEQKYPKAMKHFGEWIDKYKLSNPFPSRKRLKYEGKYGREVVKLKYYELPIAMQIGIFEEFVESVDGKDIKEQRLEVEKYIKAALSIME